MSAPQRIVVGVDIDGSTDNAVGAAIDLAQRFQASIELVHAVAPAGHHGSGTADAMEAARRAVRAQLQASLSGALLQYIREEHHLVVQTGHQGQVLLARAAEPGTGLIVLGAHRRRGLLDLRSTAQYVLSRAACPVWMQAGPVGGVHRILVAVDLSDESLQALATACAWAGVFGARISVLHAVEGPEIAYMPEDPLGGSSYVMDRIRQDAHAAFDTAMAAFDWKGVEHECHFVEGHPVSAILQRQDETDLIVLGTHGRTGFSAVILGSVAGAVVREAHVPVVTLRVPGRRWLMPD